MSTPSQVVEARVVAAASAAAVSVVDSPLLVVPVQPAWLSRSAVDGQ
jgi:hypothetical protein